MLMEAETFFAWCAISESVIKPRSGSPIRLAEVTFPNSFTMGNPTFSASLAVMQS